MLNSKEIVLNAMRHYGMDMATEIQANASTMTGTELYENEDFIPDFSEAVKVKNMMQRKAGQDGFVCLSPQGRVVFLLQNYDSDVETREPEVLISLWGFKWSKDPRFALPFIAISTSPFMDGDCCTENDKTYRSKINNNVYAPSVYPQVWEEVVL